MFSAPNPSVGCIYVVKETLQRSCYHVTASCCAAALSCNSGIVQCGVISVHIIGVAKTRRSEAFGMDRSSSSGAGDDDDDGDGGSGRRRHHHRGRHRHFHYHPHGHHHC
ncbi:Uncharacterized protein BM_BM648 [Brugia malayi]|uniref:Uncharacterized protein n=1 Tax=Brugia malayi TaxID=6279 RepID=A0A4E9F4Z7_BRUMA|nr:Uncharacterized protein BM_BM648 [Brugia malayi]VIO91839.1 Uncharacterized protein BM_BM648 [Brugia malayi]